MKRRFFGTIAFATIFALGLGIGWGLSAKAQAPKRPVTSSLATAQQPATPVMMNGLQVVTGDDVGVRIDSQAGGRVTGTLVVKVGGTWREVQPGIRAQ